MLSANQAHQLDKRSAARARVETVRDRSNLLGWDMPSTVTEKMSTWEFDQANESMDGAEAVMDTLKQAQPLFDRAGWRLSNKVKPSFENGPP